MKVSKSGLNVLDVEVPYGDTARFRLTRTEAGWNGLTWSSTVSRRGDVGGTEASATVTDSSTAGALDLLLALDTGNLDPAVPHFWKTRDVTNDRTVLLINLTLTRDG